MPNFFASERQKCLKSEKKTARFQSAARQNLAEKDKNQIRKQGKVGGFEEIGTSEISREISLAAAWYRSFLNHPSNGCHTCSWLAF